VAITLAALELFRIMESEIKNAGGTTERVLRLVELRYDVIYSWHENPEDLTKFADKFERDMKALRGEDGEEAAGYERVLDSENEDLVTDSTIDDKRNSFERLISQVRRDLMLYAQSHGIITNDMVKEYLGQFRGSMTPGGIPDNDMSEGSYRA
jgi:hypothetical protein